MDAFGGIGTGLLGGVASAIGQASANQTNMEIADKQMAFQAEQTSTAYQRATADMAKAGINPMLAYMKGGADSGVGATAQMGNVGAAFNQGMESSAKRAQASAMAEQADNQSNQLKAQTEKTKAEQANVEMDTKLKPANLAIAAQNAKSSAEQAEKAGSYKWYNTMKQVGSDLMNSLGTTGSAKAAEENINKGNHGQYKSGQY